MLWTCWTGDQCFWRSLSRSFGCLSPFVCLLWMSLLYLSQSVIWVFVSLCLSTMDVSVVPVSVCNLGVCLSTLNVSVVPVSVSHLGLCHPLSVYSGCLCCTCLSLSFGCLSLFVCMLNVSVSVCLYFPDLTIFILFYWICRVLLFFLSRISGSGSGSQSVSGSEPFHTTVSTVYTFWKIANTICSKQLILRKHVLKNYTKIKSYEEGSEFKKMVNFPPSA